jgi:hypothetical protein
MSRQHARLSALLNDLTDRYGPDDAIVVGLREQIAQQQVLDAALPFGERRKERRPPQLWGQRQGQGHARLGSRPGI